MTDAVSSAGAAVDSLAAAAARVAHEYGDTLGVRRLLSDVARLRDDLAELGQPLPGHRPGVAGDLVEVDDRPYDESMWHGAESESQHAF